VQRKVESLYFRGIECNLDYTLELFRRSNETESKTRKPKLQTLNFHLLDQMILSLPLENPRRLTGLVNNRVFFFTDP
jgi:hypothetical protein